jgi:signal transduction histidine kinase
VALLIVSATLWYSNHIASRIREGEREKVNLWSEAIQRRAELVNYTQRLFEELRDEERKKADLLASAYRIISDPNNQNDLTFVTGFLWSNTTIPVLIYENNGELWNSVNLPEGKEGNKPYIDSLFREMKKKNAPIALEEVGQKIYYDDSRLFSQLQITMTDLINSFISETVINSASVPVIVTDSSRTKLVRVGNIDTLEISSPDQLQKKLASMQSSNPPIEIQLPGQGKQLIFYEDSEALRQLQMYPVVQLILIGVFLLVSYLIFSTYRKAEQNQVWVGMAKETAHQLGTPLSSLIAWSELLDSQGVDPSLIVELNKDIDRLKTITDRFSKIGSKPDTQEVNAFEVLKESFDYLSVRASRKVHFELKEPSEVLMVPLNVPLFSWVLENLVKNGLDAMDGKGTISGAVFKENGKVCFEISDSGKGIAKNKWTTVFNPGYTTKKRGWGLGLTLAKRIIENYHNGKIFVKWSEQGKGTTFRIEIW